MIVDTSTLIAILRREPESDRLVDRLLTTPEARISAGTMLETRIVAERDGGTTELKELIEAADIEVVPVDSRQIDLAFDAFTRYGKGRHRAGLNFGDLFAYALSRALDEALLFKGDDFVHTDVKAA